MGNVLLAFIQALNICFWIAFVIAYPVVVEEAGPVAVYTVYISTFITAFMSATLPNRARCYLFILLGALTPVVEIIWVRAMSGTLDNELLVFNFSGVYSYILLILVIPALLMFFFNYVLKKFEQKHDL